MSPGFIMLWFPERPFTEGQVGLPPPSLGGPVIYFQLIVRRAGCGAQKETLMAMFRA